MEVPRCAFVHLEYIHSLLCMLLSYCKILPDPAIPRQLFQSALRQVSPQIPPDSGATPEMAGIASCEMLK